ncbi:phosphate permease [Vararia minispora EC-137]|uniref:Phosphate permease n=1 Tax=Vararia minispora EC-137 TaxID=1314806 RepID=A0ACB8QV09_9AGAM|nr:phosphate permease [Vararia minispora EC-137]
MSIMDGKEIVSSDSQMDLDERRRAALAEIDNAKFSSFHVKICAVAGVGFFTDAYDIFSISIVATMLGYVYNKGQTSLGTNQDLGVKVATPLGNLVGQLLFGWLADVLGRKKMYGIELMVIIFSTFAQALSAQGPGLTMTGVIVVWRFLLGVGIGGDYPLSSVISSEFASTRIRGRLMTAVFAFQGWGNLASAIVSIICIAAFKNQIVNDTDKFRAIDIVWRLITGIGIIPAIVALYFRLTIPETPRFTMDVDRNVLQAAEDIENVLAHRDFYVDEQAATVKIEAPKATRSDFIAHFGQWKNFKVLFGTAWSWFALDIAFYGLGLNTSSILQTIGFAGSHAASGTGQNRYDTLHNVAVGNIILAFGGLIPGYWATFLFIDTWGRKPIQFMGFTMLTMIFIVMGFGYGAMQKTSSGQKAFVFLYCLANFFQNFGPNTTTFIVPGEAFPTRYRSTAHGISAASGKLGAVIAQVGFARLQNLSGVKYKFLDHILEIFAFFMLTGIFSTILIPETKGKTLEELSNEDQHGFVHAKNKIDALEIA